jgi:hypothetical protein
MSNSMSAKLLPVMEMTAETFRLTYRNFATFVAYAWPWLLLFLALSCIANWRGYPSDKVVISQNESANFFHDLFFPIINVVIGSVIAVPWHRFLVLNEPPNLFQTGKIGGTALKYTALIIGGLVASMVLVALFTAFIVGGLYLSGTGKAVHDFNWMLWIPTIGIGFSLTCIIGRISLVLPAVATDADDTTVATAWSVTRGNTFRMAVASIAVLLPSFVSIALILWIAGDPPQLSRLGYTISSVITDLINMTIGMTSVTFLSLAYRHFFGPIENAAAAFPSPD